MYVLQVRMCFIFSRRAEYLRIIIGVHKCSRIENKYSKYEYVISNVLTFSPRSYIRRFLFRLMFYFVVY